MAIFGKIPMALLSRRSFKIKEIGKKRVDDLDDLGGYVTSKKLKVSNDDGNGTIA